MLLPELNGRRSTTMDGSFTLLCAAKCFVIFPLEICAEKFFDDRMDHNDQQLEKQKAEALPYKYQADILTLLLALDTVAAALRVLQLQEELHVL